MLKSCLAGFTVPRAASRLLGRRVPALLHIEGDGSMPGCHSAPEARRVS